MIGSATLVKDIHNYFLSFFTEIVAFIAWVFFKLLQPAVLTAIIDEQQNQSLTWWPYDENLGLILKMCAASSSWRVTTHISKTSKKKKITRGNEKIFLNRRKMSRLATLVKGIHNYLLLDFIIKCCCNFSWFSQLYFALFIAVNDEQQSQLWTRQLYYENLSLILEICAATLSWLVSIQIWKQILFKHKNKML